MQITQEPDMGIRVDQSSYVSLIKPITLEQNRMANKLADLSNDEITLLRGALGQLNWLANMTRPDISLAVSKLRTNIKKSTIADIREVNKVSKHVKDTPFCYCLSTIRHKQLKDSCVLR